MKAGNAAGQSKGRADKKMKLEMKSTNMAAGRQKEKRKG